MLKYTSILVLFVMFISKNATAQITTDSSLLIIEHRSIEYRSIEEALKNPQNVYKLNLSNQRIQFSDTLWAKFTNLKYLSLKNDSLAEIPAGIGNIKTLEVLDLSGNDFRILPSTFINLSNLQELYLNDDKNFQLDKSISLLSALPKLKSLHIENDGLTSLPKDIVKLSHLESLYLNNNKFEQIPPELREIKTLRFVDFHDNRINIPSQERENKAFGFKIRF